VADRESAFREYGRRTQAEVALGKAEHKVTLAAFAPVVGPGFKPGRYPLLVAMFADLDAEAKAAVDPAKEKWKRPRPYVLDAARFSEPGDPEKSPGYPSGHSTRGTLFSLILAEIFPERREEILAKGRLIGWTRVEIGVHTPLVIYAGRVVGQALAQALLADPGFQRDLASVKAEVAAAR
jgi:acid phosphatase (class A)